MASLFQIRVTRYVDESGKRVPKATPGAKRVQERSKKWYGEYFCNWLVTHDRLQKNPLILLKRVNIQIDRRHDRRSLTDEEFRRLIIAAQNGVVVEGISGVDRAMLYVLATWTGYRRRELASLTLRSLSLDAATPIITVRAGYSKRRRVDTIPLHPCVVEQLRQWLKGRSPIDADQPLFPLKTPKGYFRKTAKMMQHDLQSARQRWIAEAGSEKELTQRQTSDFLQYRDENGMFADFHANRHTFISNLGRAGVPLTIAQKLARHSDPSADSEPVHAPGNQRPSSRHCHPAETP